MIDAEFLSILGCPLHPDRPPFEQQGDYLICTVERHGFPVIDGIPHLLPEDVIQKEELEELLNGR